MWHWKLNEDLGAIINEYVQRHLFGVAVILLLLGVFLKASGRNSDLGMKALYGWRQWLSMLISITAIGCIVVLSVILLRL